MQEKGIKTAVPVFFFCVRKREIRSTGVGRISFPNGLFCNSRIPFFLISELHRISSWINIILAEKKERWWIGSITLEKTSRGQNTNHSYELLNGMRFRFLSVWYRATMWANLIAARLLLGRDQWNTFMVHFRPSGDFSSRRVLRGIGHGVASRALALETAEWTNTCGIRNR